ncbi:MAG: ATP-binding protein [Acidimicrobiales bacterium]
MDPHDGGVEEGLGVDERTSLQRFLEMSIDLLAVLALDTTMLEASQSWERSLGWPTDLLIGRPLLELVHPDDLPAVQAELAGILAGGDAVAVVVRLQARDGSHRWVQGNARSDRAAGRIYVTAADITDRKILEEALRSQLELEDLVASIASRLIGAEHEHIVSEIQRGVAEIAQVMGADRGHFLRGRRRPDDATYVEWRNPATVQDVHAPPPDREVQRWWEDVLRAERLLRYDDVEALTDEAPHVVQALREDGVRSLLHVPLPPQRGYWGFLTMVGVQRTVSFSDAATALLRLAGECFMTALAQCDDEIALLDARRELEQRNEALERSNEELERFAYSAAHDLKAPLSRIEMALSAAAPPGSGPGTELLDIARRGATRMRQLIEDLLAFSAVGKAAGALVPVDLDEVLSQVLADLEPVITAGDVTVERSPLPEVLGHAPLLGQLLQNLVTNAVKFARPDVPALIRIGAERNGDGVTLTVADNGVGIAPDHRSEVFSVFTRLNLDDSSPGSGVGLATCAKVVHHHGGRIWVDDGIDGGAALRVWLPDERVA